MAGGQDGGRRPRRGRGLLIALAVLIPAVPVEIGIAIGLGGSSAAPAVTTTAGFTPVPSRATAAGKSAAATTPKTSKTDALRVPPGPGAIVAVLRHPTTLRANPGGRKL